MPSISERNRSKGVKDAKHSVCACEAGQIVLGARLPASMAGHPNGDGGVPNGHNSCKEGDDAELVEVGNLQAKQQKLTRTL